MKKEHTRRRIKNNDMHINEVIEQSQNMPYIQINNAWTHTNNPIEMFEPYGIERDIRIKQRKRNHTIYGESKPGPIDIHMTLPSGEWWMVIGCRAASAYDDGMHALKRLGYLTWDAFDITWDNHTRDLKICLKEAYRKAA